jgi:quercetin dioxygenase-like cupin family protein
MKTAAVKVVGPQDGKAGFLGSIGVRFMIDGEEAGERFSLVEHPMSPRALAAPLHRHTREDEYSYVLEGRVGALLGDEVVTGGPSDLIFTGAQADRRSPTSPSSPRAAKRASTKSSRCSCPRPEQRKAATDQRQANVRSTSD